MTIAYRRHAQLDNACAEALARDQAHVDDAGDRVRVRRERDADRRYLGRFSETAAGSATSPTAAARSFPRRLDCVM